MAPPSNVLGSHLSEMAFVNVTPDVTDVFFFRAPQYVRPINCVLSTPLLLKKDREMKAHAFYTVSGPRVACREEGSDWLNLER